MLDIETLGTQSNSVVLSISSVQFNLSTGEMGNEFHIDLNIDEQLKNKGIVDYATIMWWFQQDDDARKKVVEASRYSVTTSLNNFNSWIIETFGDDKSFEFWGNSNRFDIGILQNLYDNFNIPFSWDYRKERDVRTLVSFNPEIKKQTVFKGVKHYGIDDCKYQIEYCCKIFQLIV